MSRVERTRMRLYLLTVYLLTAGVMCLATWVSRPTTGEVLVVFGVVVGVVLAVVVGVAVSLYTDPQDDR